jgi:para-aminobenzoate synthetase component 1
MATAIFEIEKVIFEAKALKWVQQFAEVCYLQSNGYVDEYGAIEAILAVDAIDTFESDDSATFQKLEIFNRNPKSTRRPEPQELKNP